MNKICFGCGAKLQTSNPNLNGYIPFSKKDDASYCKRCFKLIHYGINKDIDTPKSIDSIITSINNSDKYVIFLVDFLNICEETINIFKRINSKKMLLISKCDIVPKSIKYNNIISFVRDEYNLKDEIKLVSSYNNIGIKAVENYLYSHHITSAYIVGESNSGKSSFINKIIKSNNSLASELTVSNKKNTTLDFIRIKINDNLELIDSPGFITSKLSLSKIDIKDTLKGYIKPKSFQMKKGEILKMDNIFLKFNSDNNIVIYQSNDGYVKKYFKSIIFYDSIKVKDNSDLIIKGLGFINIKSADNIEIFNLDKKYIEVRRSIFR